MQFPVYVKNGNARVPIYKTNSKQGIRFVVSHRETNGKRKLDFFSRLESAQERADQIARDISGGDAEMADIPMNERAEFFSAKKMLGAHSMLLAIQQWNYAHKKTEGRVVEAADAWANAHGRGKSMNFARAVEAFISEKSALGIDAKRTYLAKLKFAVEVFRDRKISEISADELRDYLARQKPVTRNDYRKKLVVLFGWARDRKGWLPMDRKTEIERVERAREPERRIGILDVETWRRCLEWVRENQPQDLAALALAGFCGLRSAEIHGKRSKPEKRQVWADVHLERGKRVLNVSAAKVNTPAWRLAPICEAGAAWLGLCERREDGFVARSCALDWIRKGLRGAGFALPDNCFRHSFISHRVAATDGNKQQVASEAGNSVSMIDSNYRVPLTREEGRAWFEVWPRSRRSQITKSKIPNPK